MQAEPFRPVLGPRCRLLLTTRDREIVTALGAQHYALDTLPKHEALTFLSDWAGHPVETLPDEALSVANHCAGLPLALALCGAQIKDNRTWADLLFALRNAELDFLDHPHGSVMRSLEVSVDALPHDQRERYGELVVFSEDGVIPEAAITMLWEHTGGLAIHHGPGREELKMLIIGCDYHPSVQQIAVVDTETGDYSEHRLKHSEGDAEKLYRDLKSRAVKVRVGLEATGHRRWFERLLKELDCEVWIGDAAQIAAMRVRKQKTDRQDAQFLLKLMMEDRFPRVWVPSLEDRDLQQLLWHRHRLVQMRTRILNQLQAVAMNEGMQRRGGLRSKEGRKRLEQLLRSSH